MWESMGKHKVGLVEYCMRTSLICVGNAFCVCVCVFFFTSLFNQNTKKSYLVMNLPTKNCSQYFSPHGFFVQNVEIGSVSPSCQVQPLPSGHLLEVGFVLGCWWDGFLDIHYDMDPKNGVPKLKGDISKGWMISKSDEFFCFKPKNPDPSNVT